VEIVKWSRLVPSRPATRILAAGLVASAAAASASAVLAQTGGAGQPGGQAENSLPGWTSISRGEGTQVEFAATRTSRVLRVDSGPDGFAGITRLLRDKTQVSVKALVNLKKDGLKPGASRPIFIVGGDRGHSQQAGIIRTRSGLRWGTWRITAAGKRVDVAVSRKTRVHKGAWQTVTYTSNWNGRARSALSTGTAPVTGSPASKLPGVRANRVSLALGKASKTGGKSVLLVRRATVRSRAGRSAGAGAGDGPAAPPPTAKLSHELEPYAPTFAFNERVPAGAATDPRSGGIVSQLAENVSLAKIAMFSGGEVPPVYVAKQSDPFYSVNVGGKQTRFRVPPGVQAGGGSDAPLVILDPSHPDHGRHTELRLWRASVGSGTLSAQGAGLFHYNNDGGILNPNGTPSHSIPFSGFGTGSGLSILAGLIRPDEVRLGRINHALRFAYSASDFNSGYRAPAIKTDQPNGTSTRNPATAMEMGTRFQLDPSVNCATRTAGGRSASSLETRYVRIICKALQDYGMIVMDGTGDRLLAFQMEDDSTADWPSLIGTQHNGGWGYLLRDQTSPADGASRDASSGIPWNRMRVLARSDF
jgi:hypothetical protein